MTMSDQRSEHPGVPIYLDDRDPEIDDPAGQIAGHRWLPANRTTFKLTRCLEAFRDLKTALVPLASAADLATDKRAAKLLVVPVYNVAMGVRDLFNDIHSNSWSTLDPETKEGLDRQFRLFGEKVPTDQGALKTIRDKIGAHLVDNKLFPTGSRPVWEQFDIRDVLEWIYYCVEMIGPLLELDAYAWSRSSGNPQVANIMSVDGSEVSLLIEDGEPTMIVGLRLTRSPREGIVREVQEVVAAWVEVAKRLGLKPDAPDETATPAAKGPR
jgi:hypothetical protein